MRDKNAPRQFPTLTHHQFMLINALVHLAPCCPDGVRSSQIRTWMLNRFSMAYQGPAFYQCMARLEQAGMVKGKYSKDPFVEDGQAVERRVRTYELLEAAKLAYKDTIQFYKWVQTF